MPKYSHNTMLHFKKLAPLRLRRESLVMQFYDISLRKQKTVLNGNIETMLTNITIKYSLEVAFAKAVVL